MFLLFVVTAIPIFLFSKKVVVLVYGEEYHAAGLLLSLFAIRLFFANMGVAKSLFITNENLFRYSLLTAVTGSVINVVLNYILIPKYASVGAIWSMIASFFVTIFFIDLFYADVRKNLKVMVKGILTPWKFKLG
jgi:O-antigen/teichoic acid export membrane protein